MEAILGDVKTVTARVSQQTERVDHAITGTMDRVDETAERVKHSVRDKVNQATGVVRGIRAVVASVLSSAAGHGNGGRPGSSADRRAGFEPSNLNGRNGIEYQEGTWRTNTIGSSGKMAAGRF